MWKCRLEKRGRHIFFLIGLECGLGLEYCLEKRIALFSLFFLFFFFVLEGVRELPRGKSFAFFVLATERGGGSISLKREISEIFFSKGLLAAVKVKG